MPWWDEFQERIEPDAPVGRMTWFRVGGRSRWLARPRGRDELAAVVARARAEGLALRVLGGGANVLIRDDGVDGLVVRLDDPAFRQVEVQDEEVTVGAGVDLMPLVRRMSQHGRRGLEALAGIPGTVGGAVRMNAGGPAGSFGDVVESVEVLEPGGEVRSLPAEALAFGYRCSAVGRRVVLEARLRLESDDPVRTQERYRELFARKSAAQPLGECSAGCIFKNPEAGPAGKLIDEAGLKGTRVGGAVVAQQHANFIVAEKGATASDVLRLIDRVRDRVRAVHGVELELEIEVW